MESAITHKTNVHNQARKHGHAREHPQLKRMQYLAAGAQTRRRSPTHPADAISAHLHTNQVRCGNLSPRTHRPHREVRREMGGVVFGSHHHIPGRHVRADHEHSVHTRVCRMRGRRCSVGDVAGQVDAILVFVTGDARSLTGSKPARREWHALDVEEGPIAHSQDGAVVDPCTQSRVCQMVVGGHATRTNDPAHRESLSCLRGQNFPEWWCPRTAPKSLWPQRVCGLAPCPDNNLTEITFEISFADEANAVAVFALCRRQASSRCHPPVSHVDFDP